MLELLCDDRRVEMGTAGEDDCAETRSSATISTEVIQGED
jgi:hypothetical protein